MIKEEKNKFYLNKSLRLYLFVSYSPCGAAAYLSDPIKRPKFEHKSLNSSSSVITVDGHSLAQVKKLRHKQQYANPLAKCSLFKLYLQLMDHLPSSTTTYARAKALSSNSLRNQFMENNPQWIKTDPDIFYSFTLSSA